MNMKSLFTRNSIAAAAVLAAGLIVSCSSVGPANRGESPAHARLQPASAEAYGLSGNVEFAMDGAAWKPVRLGTELRPDSAVRTGPQSGTDLVLGKRGPLLHLAENTLLEIEKLEHDDHGDGIII